ncbi:ATP-dependent protease [Rhodococcus sp. 05-2254-5]|uniref:LON peptidase substrate-binding domain-containing protein n=1 Tax=unclassified Rhodococcus (in: high G+C Gram-positive bacteria) TaxID=192944 RepID=UPI000B9B0508|nr:MULTISPECIES: LON peptidase substrate-binding domain-containing protein [unclassified Rhodococcus (in: high G+C Gram-positive bacteria)]OZE34938.1 ATP-dependent protease [Rhodococcus sp. 05-2254-5]OZE57312.1 ATP-dependent protease [Rhodococcus sp. 05-2254-1]OZE57600.1 ATP-dependent protease [Rhodococcus sp. 05-2254-1]
MSVIPMFPLGSVLLPGERLPLHIFEPRYQALVQDCLKMDDPRFGVVLIARGHEAGGGDVRHDVATIAHIIGHEAIGDGRYLLECVGGERIRIDAWLPDDPYPMADVRAWPDADVDAVIADTQFAATWAKVEDLYELIGRLESSGDIVTPGVPDFLSLPISAAEKIWSLASLIPMGQSDRLDILSAPDAPSRLKALDDAIENVTAVVQFRLQP